MKKVDGYYTDIQMDAMIPMEIEVSSAADWVRINGHGARFSVRASDLLEVINSINSGDDLEHALLDDGR